MYEYTIESIIDERRQEIAIRQHRWLQDARLRARHGV